ncbi:hypothetical protein G8761_18130 [Bacillus sp. C11]|nr:CocE/NonD family hydrolase C-terminal non-catalytic domain-containing protein [Neobacillus terrae]NHM32489.1 hypothetical protein [Neobacillus terrae]
MEHRLSLLQVGWLRVSGSLIKANRDTWMANSFSHGTLLRLNQQEEVVPGQFMKLNVEIFPTNAFIQKGHKLRIAVGPSDFPHSLSPLPQFGKQLGGIVTIMHDSLHLSSVVLPIVK